MTNPGPGQEELVDALVRSSFAVMAVLSRIGAEHDLSLTQLRMLGILRDRRVKMSELADYLGLDKSTSSGLVSRAEKRRLIERAPNPADGRAVDVFLTAAGMELAGRGAAQVARALSPMTGALTPDQTRQLTTMLEQLLESGEAQSALPGPVPGNPAIRGQLGTAGGAAHGPGCPRYHRRNVAGIRRARRMTVSPQVVPTLQEPR
jgi:DNA-binding MarR family transcriptional regulator